MVTHSNSFNKYSGASGERTPSNPSTPAMDRLTESTPPGEISYSPFNV